MTEYPYTATVTGWSQSQHRTVDAARRAAKRSQNEARRHSGGPAPVAAIYEHGKFVEWLG